jgi:hypothetical protein
MRPPIQKALQEKDPFDFLCSLEAVYQYRRPSDFPLLTDGGKIAVCIRSFYQCFGSAGYAQVISELHDWLPDIGEALTKVGAEPFASGIKRLMQLAAERGLDVHDEDDAMILEEIDDYHSAAMRRDYPHLQRVSDCLRQYVEIHGEDF